MAQDIELDSIKAAVENHTHEDTIRVNLLIELTRYHASRDISEIPPLVLEALELSRKLNYARGIGQALNVQSKHYIVTGELDLALPLAIKAQGIFDSLNYKPGLIATNNNLARIYNVNGAFEKSLTMHLRNVDLVKGSPATSEKAGMYFYVAKTFESLNDFSEAEIYYQEALSISQACGFHTGVAIAEGSLGGVYNNLGRYQDAISYLNKTLKYSEQYGHTTNIAASCYSLSDSYLKLGKYEDARYYIDRSTVIYRELKHYRMLKDCYYMQVQIMEKLGAYPEALDYLMQHMKLKDSLFSENKVKVIEELQTKYETEKKEAEIAALSQEAKIQDFQLKKQKYGLFGLGFMILLTIGSGFLIYRQRQLKQQKAITDMELVETKKRLEIEQQYRASELKALRSQMNPHFMFNALNSIQEYIMLNEKKLAGKYLGKFADLMRTYLNHSQRKSVSVQDEVDALKLYLELEKLRFEDTLNYEVFVDPEIDPEDSKLPALLIQPFVENALKHGLLHQHGQRILQVKFSVEGRSLLCEIIDNGIGRKASEAINHSRNSVHHSYATGAIKERIDLINYALIEQVTEVTNDLVDAQGVPIGTHVMIKIPLTAFSAL
ncbi:MAG: histidine kinase [Marinoscillum sp.]